MGIVRIEEIDRELMELLEVETRSSPFSGAYDFMVNCVWTIDEAKGEIRKFPRMDYVEYLSKIRGEHQIFVIEKSRRMMITWWMLCEYLYDTLTKPNHANFIGSRKMETSAYLLGRQRLLGIWERIPEDKWKHKPRLKACGKFDNGYERLECPDTGSYIQAIASGADQLRQYTASNVLADEFAFWEKAEESYTAFRPTIQGGGHIDLVSTANLGAYMGDLIYD